MPSAIEYQELMIQRMKTEKWSQRKVAEMVTSKVGHKVYASAVNRLLAVKPQIPAGDVLNAFAVIFEADPVDFAKAFYTDRYASGDLTQLGDFVRDGYQQVDEEDKRRIIEIITKAKSQRKISP